MKQLCLVVLLAGQLLFLECGTPTIMAAGSSATGNAKVEGTVIDHTGNPAANIAVLLRTVAVSRRGDSGVVVQTTRTGADGAFLFDSVKAGKYAVYSRDSADGYSAIVQKIFLADDSSSAVAHLALTTDVVVNGRIIAPNPGDLKAMIVAVPGMGRAFTTDSMGNYALTQVPRGPFDVAFIQGTVADFLTVPAAAGPADTSYVNDVQFTQTQAQAQGVDTFYAGSLSGSFQVVSVEKQNSALLFDDFENPLSGGVAHNEIYALLPSPGGMGSGQWVVRPNADGHIVSPAVFPDNFDSCIVTDGAFHGNSMRIFIYFNQGQPPTGGIGVDICIPRVYYDLSKMTEFSFYAKGSGCHRVVFHTDTVEYGEGEFIYEFTIPTAWQRISIKNTDLVPNPGSQTAARGITWQSASRGVTSLSFFALTSDTLYMDDVYMFGITTADMTVTSPGNQMP